MFITYDNNSKKIQKNSHIPVFCDRYFEDDSKKCKKFYEDLNDEESCVKECPYGFSCVKT